MIKKCIVLFIIFLFAACSFFTADQPKDITAETQDLSGKSEPIGKQQTPQNLNKVMADMVPDGWERVDDILEFTPENLYEHINGNAELYLAYDVVKLTFASYANSADASEFFDIFVYDMGSAVNAYGIFTIERFDGEPSVDLGRMAYQSNGNIFIWKGSYYIQIIASDATEKLRETGMRMARNITDALVDNEEKVWGLIALPSENLVPHSIKYFRVDAMGLDFMNNTYTAEYQNDDARLRMFVSPQTDVTAAKSLIDQYMAYVNQYGKGIEKVSIDGIDLVLCNMGNRYNIIFQKNNLAGGILSSEDKTIGLKLAAMLWKQL